MCSLVVFALAIINNILTNRNFVSFFFYSFRVALAVIVDFRGIF